MVSGCDGRCLDHGDGFVFKVNRTWPLTDTDSDQASQILEDANVIAHSFEIGAGGSVCYSSKQENAFRSPKLSQPSTPHRSPLRYC